LSVKNLYFLGYLFSERSRANHSQITWLILWGLLLLFVFALLHVAIVQTGEEYDFEDLTSFEHNKITWIAGPLSPDSLLAGFQLGVLGLIQISEVLRSHIGEKRPAGSSDSFKAFSARALFIWTALFGRAVLFISFPQHRDNVNGRDNALHFVCKSVVLSEGFYSN
jgi:hypothetical protein